MKIQFNTNYAQQKIKPNFKSNITFDIGGSQREGSCKIRYSSTPDDVEFAKKHTTVNNIGYLTFEDPDDVVKSIINKVQEIQKDSVDIVQEKGYELEENSLKNIAIFVPSYTAGNTAFYLPNLRNYNDKPLKDISFDNLKERLQAAGVLVSDDLNFKLLQDAMGTGLAMTERLYRLGMLEEGSLYTACITGGGCAISNIEAVDEENIIIKSSGSSYLSESLNLQKVSKAGASAPALTENFCRAMGFNEEMINDIKSCNKAEFVLNPQVRFKKDCKTEKLKDILLETGAYECIEDDSTAYVLQIKDEYTDKFQLARDNAIDKYCLALARLAIIKKTEGSNGMIVTGSLANAIDNCAKYSHKRGVAEMVMQHLTQSFNTYELNKMQPVYGFKVFCDKRFAIDNNTECGELVHLAKFVGSKRKNWLRLKVADLERVATRSEVRTLNSEIKKTLSKAIK